MSTRSNLISRDILDIMMYVRHTKIFGTVEERFWPRVDKRAENECWSWLAGTGAEGYGQLRVDGKSKPAHRVSYELNIGEIPDGWVVDHTCHNDTDCVSACQHRKCVNPAHLEAVTTAENKRRGNSSNSVNARKTHCKHGHEFTEDNTYRPEGKNSRQCKTCMYLSNKRRRARLRNG